MVPAPPLAILRDAARRVAALLQAGNIAGADAALGFFWAHPVPTDPDLLNAAGMTRLAQGRFAEAADLCAAAAAAAPKEAAFAFNQARALDALGRHIEAEAAYRAALAVRHDFVSAWFALGAMLHQTGALDGAEAAFRQLLALEPQHGPARLMLGAVLVDAGRPGEAESPLRRALEGKPEPRLAAALYNNLGLALRRQRKDDEALVHYDRAAAIDPTLPDLALHRAEALQNLARSEEALSVFEAALARTPDDAKLHHHYNDLLYRLDRADTLASYDRVPATRALMLGKASFLALQKRGSESHDIYRALLARDPHDRAARLGAASALVQMGRHADASAAFDALLKHDSSAALLARAAEPALLQGEPARALELCRQGLAQNPHDQACLAALSLAYRLLEDGRDEHLCGYDTLIRRFELEPPPGFADMASFNAELGTALDRLHPQAREFINQSLRGGTQTPDQLFDTGFHLVGLLRQRIDAAVTRYIAELAEDARHPFLSRRARAFSYSGSWSSRLRDCGFHVNHIHHQGWISSCYYVAVPEAVNDAREKQGWLTFGEPSFALPLGNPVRRTIQPAPGTLVLFPSYLWHGTVPFRDARARTTVAFDVVPKH